MMSTDLNFLLGFYVAGFFVLAQTCEEVEFAFALFAAAQIRVVATTQGIVWTFAHFVYFFWFIKIEFKKKIIFVNNIKTIIQVKLSSVPITTRWSYLRRQPDCHRTPLLSPWSPPRLHPLRTTANSYSTHPPLWSAALWPSSRNPDAGSVPGRPSGGAPKPSPDSIWPVPWPSTSRPLPKVRATRFELCWFHLCTWTGWRPINRDNWRTGGRWWDAVQQWYSKYMAELCNCTERLIIKQF